MDSLPLTGEYTTYALQESNPALIDYVTDSAASGTGWATGFKTSNGRIASVAGTGAAVRRYTTILELAQRGGFKTGNVSTAEIASSIAAGTGASCRSKARRSTSRTTSRRPASRSARPSRSTARSRWDPLRQTPSRHADHHRGPRAHQPDRAGAVADRDDAAGRVEHAADEGRQVDDDHQLRHAPPGSEVRIAAQGPQAANVVGVTNQTDLFHTMARALGLE